MLKKYWRTGSLIIKEATEVPQRILYSRNKRGQVNELEKDKDYKPYITIKGNRNRNNINKITSVK